MHKGGISENKVFVAIHNSMKNIIRFSSSMVNETEIPQSTVTVSHFRTCIANPFSKARSKRYPVKSEQGSD